MNNFSKNVAVVLAVFCCLNSVALSQNKIPQNSFGQHKEHERLAIEKRKIEQEALIPKQTGPVYSETLLLSSSSQILPQTTACLDKSNEVIYITSDASFDYAMQTASGKSWEAIVQDCWVFVKTTIANNTLPDSVSDNFFYYSSIAKLESLGVLDKSNVQYRLTGSKEIFNQKLADSTVSVSVFRAADLHRYR